MDRNQKEYKIKITDSAEKSYLEVLNYVFEYYTEERALEIAEDLLNIPLSLKTLPSRGNLENNLSGRKNQFRYILYKRSNSSTIKIIYFIDELKQEVNITDYFPTEMIDTKIKDRS